MLLRARQFEFRFPCPALMMGILNVTPDSFSDGGRHTHPQEAVDHALQMVEQGAAIIDVGGESTRPRATPVSEAEELHRVLPVITALAAKIHVPISVDTMKEAVAREAVAAGASIINDVGGNQFKPGMWRLAAETGCAYVAMHMRATPQTMQEHTDYADVCGEVIEFLEAKLKELGGCGIGPEQIIIDPGIGFAKKAGHNIQLLAGLEKFRRLERPLLVGVSRKTFLGGKAGVPPQERLPASLACACLAVQSGAGIIRTHDVAETLQAIRMAEQILSGRQE